MTFVDSLIAAGYVFDDENFDACYVKHDEEEGVIHCYQEGEDDGLWNYVKMTDDVFDVITEVTFDPNVNTISL
jgi:hypothetical protein